MHILSFVPIQRPLTPKQQVILRNVARGRTNKAIAAELGISEQGVKVHISRLLERYGAENRVELVTITKAWQGSDGDDYDQLTSDIAGIRDGLNETYRDAIAFSAGHGGNGHVAARVPTAKTNGHSNVDIGLAAEVRSLREMLTEINVALKLARELPATADVGPLVDAIRTRVGVALEQSAKLDGLVDTARAEHGRSRRSAS